LITLLEFEDVKGRRPFGKWFSGLSLEATLRVDIALGRLEAGNFSNVKGVGTGLFEIRISFGPGYRIYFG
jgi:putative addiction module killer protein